jgi:outer membrane protein assembly factor BamD
VKRATLLAAALLLAGCAHGGGTRDIATLASNSDEVIWETGHKAMEKKQWEVARQHFRRIIDAFPQSQHGADARLLLADSYFKEGGAANYILAAPAYRDFLTLYPSHPKSDYAQFQVAECFFMQKNGPDRDQVPTQHALEEYERLLQQYPQTVYGDTARARIAQCRFNLARAEFLAGYFYQKTRQACRASIPRYQSILERYPDYRDIDLVLYRLAECLGQTGRPAEALPHLAKLLKEHGSGPLADDARALMTRLEHATPATPPSPAASPAPQASPGA